ncbi:MAG: alanyl-tRNA editing protein [Eubacteriales bacterium]|nr:alanyl-tRNA editing protein [Eubacteriales bacterium]
MTERLYYADPYLLEFEARVTGVQRTERGWEVRLDRSAFYPTSGGQGCDLGWIGSARVVDVEAREGDVVHLVESELREGEQVRCSIDAQRRTDHMQQHCGEHMLAYLVWKNFGGFTHGLHIGEEFSSIDVTMPGGETHLSDEQLIALEEEWNEWIQSDRPVRCWFPSEEELAALPMRKESTVKEHIRVVHIAPDEYVACGGTHPRSTGEIGCGRILDARPSRGKLRLSFVCGMRAVRDNRKKTDQCLAAAELLSAQWTGLADAVKRLIDKNAELNAQMRYLQRDTALLQMQRELDCARVTPDGKKIVSARFENMDMAAMREAAGVTAEKYDCYVLCASQGEDGAVLSFVRGPGCTAAMGKLLSETAKACGGKGGGRLDFAQGSAQDAAAALAFAADRLTE